MQLLNVMDASHSPSILLSTVELLHATRNMSRGPHPGRQGPPPTRDRQHGRLGRHVVQPTTIAHTAHCHTGQHQQPSTRPDPKPPPATPATTPTTASATTESARPATSHCAKTADSTTSASTNNSSEPTSSSSSTTSTSASSTPPPAKSSATSPSTPTRTTSPPANHPNHPRKPKLSNPHRAGPEVSDVSRHHAAPLAGIEPATHGLGNRCSIH